jgi:hypothetical protein
MLLINSLHKRDEKMNPFSAIWDNPNLPGHMKMRALCALEDCAYLNQGFYISFAAAVRKRRNDKKKKGGALC